MEKRKNKTKYEGLFTAISKTTRERLVGFLTLVEYDGKNFIKEDEKMRAWITKKDDQTKVRSANNVFAEFRGYEVLPETVCPYIGVVHEYIDDFENVIVAPLFDHDLLMVGTGHDDEVMAEIVMDPMQGILLIDPETSNPMYNTLKNIFFDFKENFYTIKAEKIGNKFDLK